VGNLGKLRTILALLPSFGRGKLSSSIDHPRGWQAATFCEGRELNHTNNTTIFLEKKGYIRQEVTYQTSITTRKATMARKKASNGKPNRTDPHSNKSLAIRLVLRKMPTAKASQIADAVKKEYGHEVNQNMVYMVKTKTNMAADRRESPITSAALWVDAIKTARQLLKATGSVANATALLKALDR
jgi:hypothetical protein